ncbi:MAG: hypothetical protein ACP5SD_00185 [Elusimicrobiales bacterium]
MEYGIKLNYFDLRNREILGEKIKKYDWIYLGSEFCENLLDLYSNADKILKKFENKKICFLTPIITDKYADKLSRIIWKMVDNNKKIEISANDFGTINILTRRFPQVKINIGRHLSKHFFSFKKDAVKFHTDFSIYAAKYFEELGIKRYEISGYNKIPKTNFHKAKKIDFNITMFYPYTLLSTTRTCLIGLEDIKPEETIERIKCNKECLCCDYAVKTEKIKEELIVSQNSTFVKVEFDKNMEKALSKIKVDRIVFAVSP